MPDFGLGGIIASVLAGAAGGQAAEKQPKTPSPGGLGSSWTGSRRRRGHTIVTIVLGLILKKKK